MYSIIIPVLRVGKKLYGFMDWKAALLSVLPWNALLLYSIIVLYEIVEEPNPLQ